MDISTEELVSVVAKAVALALASSGPPVEAEPDKYEANGESNPPPPPPDKCEGKSDRVLNPDKRNYNNDVAWLYVEPKTREKKRRYRVRLKVGTKRTKHFDTFRDADKCMTLMQLVHDSMSR